MAFLQITLKIAEDKRSAAAAVYARYRAPFLQTVDGAQSKDLLIRPEDIQVLHRFGSVEQARAYLQSGLFVNDVVGELGPLLDGEPDVRIYAA